MKRDMDLIREILLECEEQDGTDRMIQVKIEGHSDEEINYHMVLLKDAGFIEASVARARLRLGEASGGCGS